MPVQVSVQLKKAINTRSQMSVDQPSSEIHDDCAQVNFSTNYITRNQKEKAISSYAFFFKRLKTTKNG